VAKGERRLAAIMFTDIVGYTSLVQTSEVNALRLLDEHRKILRPIFKEYSGREIKTIGDAFMVEFSGALDAARCAVAVQMALREWNLGSLPEHVVKVRIGIHLGDIVERDRDVYGDTVNIASRIHSLAEEDGICVSQQVYDQIGRNKEFALASLGKHELKNVSGTREVYQILLPWKGNYEAVAAASAIEQTRVAVLPFINLGPDPNDEYFAAGMTEETIASVASIHGVSVISRTSVTQYKETKKQAPVIGKELRARTILEGSVRRVGERVRVSVQMIDAVEDEHLWAESWDRDMKDVLAVQSEIADKVADALRRKVVTGDSIRSPRRQHVTIRDSRAYDYYLRGRHLLNEGAEGPDEAARYFRLAIEKDPNLPHPYAALSDYYTYIADAAVLPADAYSQAKKYAREALTLNPRLSEAHSSLALIAFEYDWNWKEAEKQFLEAIRLNRSNSFAHHWYALFLKSMGRFEEALIEGKRAEELDPFSDAVKVVLAIIHWSNQRNEAAARACEQAIQLNPGNPVAHSILGHVKMEQHNVKGALTQAREAEGYGGVPAVRGVTGWLYGKLGREREATRVLGSLPNSLRGHKDPYAVGLIYLGMGRNKDAVGKFREARSERSGWLPLFNNTPVFADLRKQRDFIRLTKEISLP
jgi:class 3 adenylate cyclase/tetratricopeptide (TPR) repeat protein